MGTLAVDLSIAVFGDPAGFLKRKDARVCLANWPTDSLLVRGAKKEVCTSVLLAFTGELDVDTFEAVTVDVPTLASRIFFARPAVYLT